MTIRFAVIGCGDVGRRHAELLHHQVAGASVIVVFDDETARATQVADVVGARVAPSINDAATAVGVDAVVVAVADPSRGEAIRAAVDCGRLAFCELPVPDMITGDTPNLHVGSPARFDDGHREVAEAVRSGVIGHVRVCRIVHRGRSSAEIATPDPLDDNAVHDVDLARFIVASEIVEVFATMVPTDQVSERGGSAVLVLTHASGAVSMIETGTGDAAVVERRVEVVGTAGTIASRPRSRSNTVLTTVLSESRRLASGDSGQDRWLIDQWTAFVEAAGGQSLETSAAVHLATAVDGVRARQVIDAARRSSRERRTVHVDEVDCS